MELSVVIPVHNEEGSVNALFPQLVETLSLLKKEYEILFIDDGSKDATTASIIQLCKQDRRCRAVILSRRYGLSAALAAGFKYAQGRTIVSMDGDFQNDPQDIPRLLLELDKGYDLVCGYRKKRSDPFRCRLFFSRLANMTGRVLFRSRVHDFSSTMRAYRSEAAKSFVLFNGAHRFIPVLAQRGNLSVGEIDISHRPRLGGVSKYNLISRFFKVIADALAIKLSDVFYGMGFDIRFKEAVFSIKEVY